MANLNIAVNAANNMFGRIPKMHSFVEMIEHINAVEEMPAYKARRAFWEAFKTEIYEREPIYIWQTVHDSRTRHWRRDHG